MHIAALGIGGGGLSDPRSERAGMAAYPADLTDTAAALGATTGDLRLLSVHYNQEMSVRPSGEDSRRLREVVQRHEIDLVAGHHAHVAAGVQIVDGALIFYGLGNFAHPGMQDMGRYGACRDYGLMARVHYSRVPGERFVARAVEVVTLDDMHMAPRPRTGADGQARIAVLNHLADGLDVNDGIRGVRFVPRADGTGIYCAAGAAAEGGAIGALCKAASVEAESAAANVKRAGAACGGDVIARRREGPVEPVVRPASTNASLVQPFASLRDFRVEAIDR